MVVRVSRAAAHDEQRLPLSMLTLRQSARPIDRNLPHKQTSRHFKENNRHGRGRNRCGLASRAGQNQRRLKARIHGQSGDCKRFGDADRIDRVAGAAAKYLVDFSPLSAG
jgi:hypothetical protein